MPRKPGVYELLDASGATLYVGKSAELRSRVQSYFRGSKRGPKIRALANRVADVRVTVTSSEVEALLLEQSLIKQLKPRYNVILRDGKSYSYIRLTSHRYPALELYRGARREGGRYFGPYPSTKAVRETLSTIQKLFRVRSCGESFFRNRSRPCLQHQIGRCTAPCVNAVPERAYAKQMEFARMFLEGKSREILSTLKLEMEAAAADLQFERAAHRRNQIRALTQIQSAQYVYSGSRNADVFGIAAGSGRAAVHGLFIRDGRVLGTRNWYSKNELDQSASTILSEFVAQFYFGRVEPTVPDAVLTSEAMEDDTAVAKALSDRAGRGVTVTHLVRSRQARWVAMARENAELSLASHLAAKESVYDRFVELREALDLDDVPERMACFDISHSGGEAPVASCVTFGQEGPIKSDYRKFNIEGVVAGDDYASMEQALQRYFRRVVSEEYTRPDVLVVDGGRGQLARAREVLTELQLDDVATIGVAKGPRRKPGQETICVGEGRELSLLRSGGAMRLLQEIRNEAHRFAIDAHRGRRMRSRRRSSLDEIPQVGPKRKRELLSRFGSVNEIKNASIEDLSNVPGISKKIAEDIRASLQPG